MAPLHWSWLLIDNICMTQSWGLYGIWLLLSLSQPISFRACASTSSCLISITLSSSDLTSFNTKSEWSDSTKPGVCRRSCVSGDTTASCEGKYQSSQRGKIIILLVSLRMLSWIKVTEIMHAYTDIDFDINTNKKMMRHIFSSQWWCFVV